MDAKAARKSKTGGAHVNLRGARAGNLIDTPGEKHGGVGEIGKQISQERSLLNVREHLERRLNAAYTLS
jgi:hypothetical protein